MVTPVSSPNPLCHAAKRPPRKAAMAWEIWPAAPPRLAHAPCRTQVIPIPHIGRTVGLSQRTCGCRRIGNGRREGEREGRTSEEGREGEREGEYLDIHLSGFRGLCRRRRRRFLSRLSQTEVAISGGGSLIFSRSPLQLNAKIVHGEHHPTSYEGRPSYSYNQSAEVETQSCK